MTEDQVHSIESLIVQRITFSFVALNDAYLPPFTGHLLRGLLYNIIAESDEELVEILHEQGKLRPYGLSKIYLQNPKEIQRVKNTGELKIKKGIQLYFDITLVGKKIKNRVIKAILERKNEDLYLNYLQLSLLSINLEPLKIPIEKQVWGKYLLEFETETQFKTKNGKIYLLPDPEKLFSSMTRMAKELLPELEVPEPKDIREVVAKYVYLRNVKITTREIDIGEKTLQVGFKGRITLIIEKKVLEGSEENQKIIQWLPILLYLGNYVNIGVKRTVGMGKVKVLKI